jgi:hypothetical protein
VLRESEWRGTPPTKLYMGLRVKGLRHRVESLGFRVWGSGFRVQGPEFRV